MFSGDNCTFPGTIFKLFITNNPTTVIWLSCFSTDRLCTQPYTVMASSHFFMVAVWDFVNSISLSIGPDFGLSSCGLCPGAPFVTPPHLHLTTSKVMVIVWRLRGNIIWTVLYWQRATSSMGTVNRNSSHSPVGPRVCLCIFLGCMIYLYVCVCFVLPWTVESFPFMFWRWSNKLKWAAFEFFAPSPLLRVRSWLHPF